MRKWGHSVSPPPTVTVEEPVRTKRRLVYTHVPMLRYSPAVFHAILWNVESPRSSESGCHYGACPLVPAGRSFCFDFPSCSEVLSCSEGPWWACQDLSEKAQVPGSFSSPMHCWSVFLRCFGLCFPNPTGFVVFGPVCSRISFGFALRQLQLSPPWLIMDVCT